MTNRLREIFDFAACEPESSLDIEQMVRECDSEELKLLERVAGTLSNAARNVRARRSLQAEQNATDFRNL